MGTLDRRALIGRRISESLERSGVSQAELGRRLGRAKSAITRWKTGESLPSVDLLLAVAEITGVEPLWLFGATAADLVALADEVRERAVPEDPLAYLMQSVVDAGLVSADELRKAVGKLR